MNRALTSGKFCFVVFFVLKIVRRKTQTRSTTFLGMRNLLGRRFNAPCSKARYGTLFHSMSLKCGELKICVKCLIFFVDSKIRFSGLFDPFDRRFFFFSSLSLVSNTPTHSHQVTHILSKNSNFTRWYIQWALCPRLWSRKLRIFRIGTRWESRVRTFRSITRISRNMQRHWRTVW